MGRATLTVHRARPADARAVAEIYVESWNAGFGHLVGRRSARPDEVDRWRSEIARPDRRWWVAERDGVVVGFAGIGDCRDPERPGLGELDTIAVAPSHWRTGVGTALMATALDALAEGYDTAMLWTVAGYDRGHAFYEASGWSADGGVRAEGAEVSFRHALARAP